MVARFCENNTDIYKSFTRKDGGERRLDVVPNAELEQVQLEEIQEENQIKASGGFPEVEFSVKT